jgi:hypothetical protein
MELAARGRGHKRYPVATTTPWQKVKLDRQIVAISKLHGARTLYSDDGDVKTMAEDVGIKAVSTWDLSPPKSKTPLLDNTGSPLEIK